VVAADRTPHPSLLELAAVAQPVRVTAVDPGRGVLRVANEHAFVDLGWLTPSWVLEVDGTASAAGTLEPLRLAPGAAVAVSLPVGADALEGPGRRACVTLSFRTGEELPWAPAGHEVAWAQVEVARAPGLTVAPGPAPTQPVALEALEPTLALWRAPIDNETFGPRHAERWERLGLREGRSDVHLVTETAFAADGGVLVTHEVVVPDELDDIPRVGVRLRLGPGVEAVEWLGVGPHECYSDRRVSGRFGRWTTRVDDWGVDYVHPQANGNRVGVRWLRFLDADGRPVLVVDRLDDLDVTVGRVTDEELAAARHLEDLPVRDECYLWIDARHRGVGSGAVGPDVAPEHRVQPGAYRWSYRLR
jgi:beta-galactosidase